MQRCLINTSRRLAQHLSMIQVLIKLLPIIKTHKLNFQVIQSYFGKSETIAYSISELEMIGKTARWDLRLVEQVFGMVERRLTRKINTSTSKSMRE